MKHSALFIAVFCLCTALVACNPRQNKNEGNNVATDSVCTDRTLIELSYQIPGDTGKKCDVKISLEYPIAYQSESDLSRLNSLLASQIFGTEYSQYTSLKDAADTIALRTLNEMKDGLTTLCNEIKLSSEITFTSLTQIAPVYNSHDFLSYNSSSYSYEGGAHGMNNSAYYVIYLPTMSRITLNDVIASEYIDDVNQMLINTLVKNLDLKNSEALVDVGYFDPEGITATENFYIDNTGVTWVYNPYEIGCYAIGETAITLTYDDLSYFMPESTPLRNLFNNKTK